MQELVFRIPPTPHSFGPTLHIDFAERLGLVNDELFQDAEATVSLKTPNTNFRRHLSLALSWVYLARMLWPEQQPPKQLKKAAGRLRNAANSLQFAAEALPGNNFRDVLEELKNQAEAHRRSADDLHERAEFVDYQHKKIGALQEHGGRPPMIAFTALVALLAVTYERSIGKAPAVSVSPAFSRLAELAVNAIRQAERSPPEAKLMTPGSRYATKRHVERTLKALRRKPPSDRVSFIPDARRKTETSEQRHIASIQNLLRQLGLVGYPPPL